jgi:hypothetical protein
MKYSELIQFEPINEVIKFSRTSEVEYQKNLVSTFVFSNAYETAFIPTICKILDYNTLEETFGLQVVGNYGTGKSHLMSLVSLIAENADLLNLVTNDKAKAQLNKIAGKFKVTRFELGNSESLWEVVTYRLSSFLADNGVEFSFNDLGPISYLEKLQLMMAEFEEKFPDKGVMIVIDEMLSYLKGRSDDPAKLNSDLQVLQALGLASDSSKFRVIFGVQEMIYHSPEFQFAAQMLLKVKDRYRDITITKDDVSFVVKKRLLRKDEHQKQKIRTHLNQFLALFSNIHSRIEEYVELYPVHPSYFENFQLIKSGKSQREILKTLSAQFQKIIDTEVPANNPGLITYDMYWTDMAGSTDLMSIPDVRKVKEITDTIHDKIETNLIGVRAAKKPIAKRITNAAAIKILQADLNKQNGVNAEQLLDDLCYTDAIADEREMLLDIIDTTAKYIVTATSGQYFDQNADNFEYHLRVEGGVNFDQRIKDYAGQMSPSQKDSYFFRFLENVLPLEINPYRSGFDIWEHEIDWKSHKTFRSGYIFFGNPNERSTTQPRQHFYMYAMPIFDDTKKAYSPNQDEVYFIMDKLSDDFKQQINLYGAAKSLEASADTTQKPVYIQKIKTIFDNCRKIFDSEYLENTRVDYMGKQTILKAFPLPGAGSSKMQIFDAVSSNLLENYFEAENPNYPKFTQLNGEVSKDNFDKLIKQALTKIATPQQSNRDGEAILSGLGLWVPGMLDVSHSIYARSIKKLLDEKGEGMVLNRDEILTCLWAETNLWISKEFEIEADLEFLVLATLAALGEIEITLSNKTINSTNIEILKSLDKSEYFLFSHIRRPKELNLAAIREMFISLTGKDWSNQLKDEQPYIELAKAVENFAKRSAEAEFKIGTEYSFRNVVLIDAGKAHKYHIKLTAFKGFCDGLRNYTSEAKLKNFKYTSEDLSEVLKGKEVLVLVEKIIELTKEFDQEINYLLQAKQYIPNIPLLTNIQQAIDKLPEILNNQEDAKIANYKAELKQLRNEYADWYLTQYLSNRISELEETQKSKVLNSNQKAICDLLKDANFLSVNSYALWLSEIQKLVVADGKVNKEAIMHAPYQGFNPMEYVDKKQKNVDQLRTELDEIFKSWDNTIRETLDDPGAAKNMSLLDTTEQKLLSDYQKGTIEIDTTNAKRICNLIQTLHKGLEKVELTTESLKATFSKPLTPDEAIEAFKKYIDSISVGKNRGNIRIILK